MQRRTSELLAHLDRSHLELHRAVSGVPEAAREQQPAPGRWSVANVLEHLSIVEPRIVHGLTQGFAAARASGLPPAPDSSVIGERDSARYLNRQRRIETTEASQPRGELRAAGAMAALEQTRAATRAFVVDTDGFDVAAITLPHPIFGPLNLYQWIVFVGGHEERHALQISEIGEALARPR
jgi:hypothetical protein